MSDKYKELLESAAASIGLTLRYNYLGTRDARQPWNPIESDADAFRLMVDCQIELCFEPEQVVSGGSKYPRLIVIEKYADHNNDKHAATRMAIVRAAAQSQGKAE